MSPAPAQSSAPLIWPFPLIWLVDHWSRDCARYWQRMSLATDPVEVVQADGVLGADLVRDSLTAWSDFWMIPLQVWSTAVTAGRDDAA